LTNGGHRGQAARAKLRVLRTASKLAKVGARRLGLRTTNARAAALARRLLGDAFVVETEAGTLQASFDNWNLLHHIARGMFDPFALQTFKSTLEPGMTVVDAGASIGLYTLVASRAVGDDGVVIALEPDPRNQADLRANVAANAATNVTLVPKAVSDRAGVSTFYLRRPAGHSGLHADRAKYMRTVMVETISLDDYLGQRPVDVVKIDVEGHEPAVLAGMRRTLERSPRLKLLIEFAPAALAAAGYSGDELVAELRTHFDRISEVDEAKRELKLLRNGVPARTCNLFCIRVRDDAR
jgi:FkbM family methyltransferase